jgi:hypothetical protein
LENVWFSKGWKIDEPFQIDWKVKGNLSQLDHFLVTIQVVRPDQPKAYFAQVMKPVKVGKGQRTCLASVDTAITINKQYYYLRPSVTAVTKDPSKNTAQSHARFGPARAVFPSATKTGLQPVPREYEFIDAAGTTGKHSIATGGPPSNPSQRRVWIPSKVETPTAIRFGKAFPATHVAVHPKYQDTITVRYEVPNITGKHLLLAHLGFMGNTSASDMVDAKLECILKPPSGSSGPSFAYSPRLFNGIGTSAPLAMPQRVIDTADLYGASGATKKADLEIEVTFSNGGSTDPKCPPGVFGLRLVPFSAGNAPQSHPVHADLAIEKTQSWLVPGLERFSGTGPTTQLVITNKGPHDVPAETLKKIRVKVNYYLGQYGNKHSDVSVPAYRKDVTCPPKLVTLTKNGPWTGPLAVGQSLAIIPTGHADLDSKGHLKLSGAPRKAWKVLKTWANIQLPAGHLLHDPHLANNGWNHDVSPPKIIGTGPLDFEVLAFQGPNYTGIRERYELNPETQRQRLIWDLGKEHNKKDMYRKVQSMMVGKKVDMVASEYHHFYSNLFACFAETIHAGSHQPSGIPKIGSMIICPKKSCGPIGVDLICGADFTLWWKTGDPRGMFLPLPQDRSVSHADFTSLPGPIDDGITQVYVWRHPHDIAGNVGGATVTKPSGSIKTTLFEDGGFGGYSRTLNVKPGPGPGYPNWAFDVFNLREMYWEGQVFGSGLGDPTIDDEVSSVKLEGQGITSFSP